MGEDFDHRITSLILTKDQLAAIGSVVVESTFCEELIESILWRLAGLKEKEGKYFTSNMQMGTRLELLNTVGKAQLRSEKRRAELTNLVSRLKAMNEARNIVVHGTWQTNGVGVFRVLQDGPEHHPPAIARKRRLNSPAVTKTAAEINAIALEIARLTTELVSFSRAWRRVPSPEKQLSQSLTHSQRPAQTHPKPQAKKPPPRSSRA